LPLKNHDGPSCILAQEVCSHITMQLRDQAERGSSPLTSAFHPKQTFRTASSALDHRVRPLEQPSRRAADRRTATRSPKRPTAMAPTSRVAAERLGGVAGRGLDRLQRGHAVLTMVRNCRPTWPCGMTPASLPNTIRTPARCALRKLSRWICAISRSLRDCPPARRSSCPRPACIRCCRCPSRTTPAACARRPGGCPRRRPGWHARWCRCRRGSRP
jgi:hypothetical protein